MSKRWAAPALSAIALAVAAQSAVAQTPPVSSLEGEEFAALRAADTEVGAIDAKAYCGGLTSARSTIKYTTMGFASGPYPGPYWEQGTATIAAGLGLQPVVAFKARFTIDSWFGRVTGTKQLDPASEELGHCLAALGTREHSFAARATYSAVITTPTGTCTTRGNASVSLTEHDGPAQLDSAVAAEFLEFFLDGDPPVCAVTCPPTADEDGDGLIDSREHALLTLLGNADSDFDGIKDGNDDANGNGEDDEDEDDDDGCPDRDSDGDGEDDEDEDDDDD